MKSQKEQRRATKSNEKQQKATKSNKKQQRTSELEKPKRARKNQDEQRRAQKVQMETRLNDEFSKLNWIIRSRLSKINSEEHDFLDEKPKPSLFKEDPFENPKASLFIDENDEGQFEKPKASLFIDDPFEKALMNARNIDLRLKRNIKITNKKFINFLETYVLP